jgi:predicted Holliday junction resolvase-like endonuclease
VIFFAIAVLFYVVLIFQILKRDKLIESMRKLNEQQQDNGKFFTKQIDHYLNEVNRLSISEAAVHNENNILAEELRELKSQQQSKSVRLGLISENVIPFHRDFKYEPKNLVPMFRPIDYLVFNEDEIVFLEIKLGTSQLSEKQRNIRRLVNEGRVRFEELRVDETGVHTKENHGKETNTESGS